MLRLTSATTVVLLTLLAACIPLGSSIGFCNHIQTLNRPLNYKGLHLPAGTQLKHTAYTNGGTCTLKPEEVESLKYLEQIILPPQQPLLWGGMPVALIDLSPAYGTEFTLLPASAAHPAEQHSPFARKWRQCGGSHDLNIIPHGDDLRFERQNPEKQLYSCGDQRGGDAAQQQFLKELATLMRQQQKQ